MESSQRFRHGLAHCGVCAAVAVTALFAGCSSIPGLSALTRKYPIADARHPVADVACIWQPGEGHTADGLPCRGFAGQFMFVSAGSRVPAKVSGSVTIYVFDDVGGLDEQSQPSEVFEFAPEQWAYFARETRFGMTYQLFVPYTRKGMHQAECAIRIRFVPADGGTPIYSEMSSITLRGKDAPPRTLSQQDYVQGPGPINIVADPVATELARKYQADVLRQSAGASLAEAPVEPPVASFQQGVSGAARLQQLEALLDRSAPAGR